MGRLYLSASDTKDGKYQREIDEICKSIDFNSEDKGARLRAVIDDSYQIRVLKSSPSASKPPSDLDHLNICDPNGAIQVYLRKRNAETERIKKRMAEAYLVEKARQNAKTEGERERAEIQKELEMTKRITKGYYSTSKPQVDWGNSEDSGDSFSLGDMR